MFGRCEIVGNLVLKQDIYCFIALVWLVSTRGFETPSGGHTAGILHIRYLPYDS